MTLTVTNKANGQQVEWMVGKAMCAYANWTRATDVSRFFFKSHVPEEEREVARAAFKSEYEATVRCIEMFVREPLHEVCEYVIGCAEAELM